MTVAEAIVSGRFAIAVGRFSGRLSLNLSKGHDPFDKIRMAVRRVGQLGVALKPA
jgi:hypothetical protein